MILLSLVRQVIVSVGWPIVADNLRLHPFIVSKAKTLNRLKLQLFCTLCFEIAGISLA